MKLKENTFIKVKVERIEQYGLIVNYKNTEGLVHLRNLSWDPYGLQERLDSGELYQVGDTLNVKVLNGSVEPFDASIKDVTPEEDPWVKIRNMDLTIPIRAMVVQEAEFGYFVEVILGLRGVIFKSSNSNNLVEGDDVSVRFEKVDFENKKIEFILHEK